MLGEVKQIIIFDVAPGREQIEENRVGVRLLDILSKAIMLKGTHPRYGLVLTSLRTAGKIEWNDWVERLEDNDKLIATQIATARHRMTPSGPDQPAKVSQGIPIGSHSPPRVATQVATARQRLPPNGKPSGPSGIPPSTLAPDQAGKQPVNSEKRVRQIIESPSFGTRRQRRQPVNRLFDKYRSIAGFPHF